jgi:hypothetical protein
MTFISPRQGLEKSGAGDSQAVGLGYDILAFQA